MSLLGRRLAHLLSAGPSGWRVALKHLRGSAAFSSPDVQIVRELAPERILVLAPHPDDEIIGPGGTLVGYLLAGSHVTVAYLTDGGGAEGDPSLVRTRRREAERVGAFLGFEQLFWDHPDTRLDPGLAEDDLIALLEESLPDSIYLPSYFEHHVDHYAANALLARALGRIETQATVYGYEVWDPLKASSLVVDVTSWLETKLKAVALYETPMEYTDFAELCRHRASLHYLLHIDSTRRSPEGAAEAFLRQGAQEFCDGFGAWHEALREVGSPIATRLGNLGAPPR